MKIVNFKIFALLSMGTFFLMLGDVFAEVSNKDLEIVEKRIKEQSIEHQKLQAQSKKINQEINSINREMIKRAKLIQNQEDKVSKMEIELEKLSEGLQLAQENFLVQDERLIKSISALQNLALKPTESLLVQPLTPVEIIRSAMLLRETIPTLEQNASRIKQDLERIETKRKLVETQVTRINGQNKKLEKDQVKLKVLAKKKSQMKNVVEAKSVQTKKKMDTLASQAKDLRDLLNKLEAQRQVKLAQERKQRAQKTDLKKTQPEGIKETGKAFARAKGKLEMPARGTIVTSYGQETARGVTSKGISLRTRNSAQVTAIFDGVVAFAGPFRGYGNLIIIEHGDGYLTLLAGLGTIDCEVGQLLLAGEPIGQMPENGDAKLYVEFRQENKNINPTTWFKK
ncbi:MAG: peptidoglycan DD-metalloendopeptidase family protein [Alphaproteobacteria bacterium]|nr:peptidoglycan DD-metalloendopeptidase family protein [Alphaproteobacteria bacterium]